jgi:exosortase A
MRTGSALLMSDPPVHADLRLPVMVCAAAVAAILFVFSETMISMVGIWRDSESFTHGFVVAPIALWLAWRRRHELAVTSVRPYWPGLLVLGGAGFLWLLGSLADANVVKHFALVVMLQSTVLVVLGLEVSRVLAFPLLFLLFAVPFGQALVPQLMDWTADFTVFALKLTGVPVYREGNSFVIPSGNWSVVEACSGIRYLVASLMAGTLFAYLTYRSLSRRVLFVVASIVVPILANWLRAYGIVMLGHVSGNKLATGVDHMIYGWIFFGAVLFLMFWVGARFREDIGEDMASASVTTGSPQMAAAVRGRVVAAAVAAVVLAIAWSTLAALMVTANGDRSITLPPLMGKGGWQSVESGTNGDWRPHFAGYRAELRQTFERDGRRVTVSIYYYAAQTQGRELINATNVLLSTKDPRWREVDRGETDVGAPEARIHARTATLAGQGERFDVAWWYWVDGRTTTSGTIAKVRLAWSRLLLRSGDSAAVFLFTEPSNLVDGPEVLKRFAGDMGQPIEAALSTVGEGLR